MLPITHRTPLPTTIPPDSAGVILVDGRMADKDWQQGPDPAVIDYLLPQTF